MLDESDTVSQNAPSSESVACSSDANVSPDHLDGSDASDSSEAQNTTIFVGSIPFESSEAEISRFFSQCGTIENCKLLLDPQTRRFKGSCFIRFDSVEAAQNACALNGNTFMGRKLYISMSTSKPAPQTTPHVFIGNLDASSDLDTLYQFFSSCGSVVNIKLITDKLTMRNRGFGFVEFADEQSAKNSLALNGTMLGSRPIRVDFQRPKSSRSPRTRGVSGGRGRNNPHFASHLPTHIAPPHGSSQLGWTGAPQYPPFPHSYPLHLHGPPHHAPAPQGILPHPHSPHGHPYFPPSRTVHYTFHQGYPMQYPVGGSPQGGYPGLPSYPMPLESPPSEGDHARPIASPNALPTLSPPVIKQSSTISSSGPGPSPISPQSRHSKIAGPPYPSYVLSPDATGSAPFPYPHEYVHPSAYSPAPGSHSMGHPHDQFD